MSEKNLQGSDGGDESGFCAWPTSILADRFTSFGNNFNGLLSGSPVRKSRIKPVKFILIKKNR